MSKRDNVALKLDILECKFRNAKARYPKTKVLIKAKNQKALSSIVNTDIAKEEALERIQVLKEEICERKVHAASLKLTRALKRIAKQEAARYQKQGKEAQKAAVEALDLDVVVRSKLCKLLEKVFVRSRSDPAPEFLPGWARDAIGDAENKYSPKHVFKTNSAVANDVISKLWNHKEVLELLKSSELSLRLVQGPVKRESKVKEIDEAAGESDSESDSGSDSESGSESGSESDSESGDSDGASDSEDVDLSAYDGMLAASSDEEDAEAALRPDVNYNEITDEEPSDDEPFDIESESEAEEKKAKKEKKEKKEKKKLPALMSGYISGGSDDEDEVVKEATTTRKNRRGQRERQRIWELKYGSRANHVQKERERVKSEREIRQQQFEERQRRREEKAKNNPNFSELKPRKTREEREEPQKELHPSWVAKQKAKEKELHTKFQGKKVVFE